MQMLFHFQVNPSFAGADRNRNTTGRKRGQGDPPLFRAPLERTSSVTTSDTLDGDTPCPDCSEEGVALQDEGGSFPFRLQAKDTEDRGWRD